jgi:nucleoside-diphosphate-sugar epimerase
MGSAVITGQPFAEYRDGAAAHDYLYVEDVGGLHARR